MRYEVGARGSGNEQAYLYDKTIFHGLIFASYTRLK